jgi:fructose-1,6-bisphosphatase
MTDENASTIRGGIFLYIKKQEPERAAKLR